MFFYLLITTAKAIIKANAIIVVMNHAVVRVLLYVSLFVLSLASPPYLMYKEMTTTFLLFPISHVIIQKLEILINTF